MQFSVSQFPVLSNPWPDNPSPDNLGTEAQEKTEFLEFTANPAGF
jgi:hypothetical protein